MALQWPVLAIVLWPVYCFITYLSSFTCQSISDCGCSPFSSCYDLFFLLLSLVLTFSSDALADSLPQLFACCFQNFAVKGAVKLGAGNSSSRSAFPAAGGPWAKLLLSRAPHLWLEGGIASPGSASALRCQVGSSCGAERQTGKERSMAWWCRCGWMPLSSVSVPDKQLGLWLFCHYLEKDSY